jgi:hypothetical protein
VGLPEGGGPHAEGLRSHRTAFVKAMRAHNGGVGRRMAHSGIYRVRSPIEFGREWPERDRIKRAAGGSVRV